MRKLIDEIVGAEIIRRYEEHVSPKELADDYGMSDITIIRYLRKMNIYNPDKHKQFYQKNKNYKVTWTTEEKQFLIENYSCLSCDELFQHLAGRHTKKAIQTKAILLGLTNNKKWTLEEDDILRKYYSKVTKDEILNMLPGRTINSIICHAMTLGVKSTQYLSEKYTDEQKQFIAQNAMHMTDKEMSEILNKPLSGVQEQRRKLGIYYLQKDYSNYCDFIDLFRGCISEWKKKTMEKCNYCCVFTGSKDFEIHHIYGFNLIVSETFNKIDEMGLLKSTTISSYTKSEIDTILNTFKQVHNSYPLGVCIDKKIHDLFHVLYGRGGNTQEQWDAFCKKFKNGDYDDLM